MPSVEEIFARYPVVMKRSVTRDVEVNLRNEQKKLGIPDSKLGELFLAHFLEEDLQVTSEPVLRKDIYSNGAEQRSDLLRSAILEVVDVVEVGHSLFNLLKAVDACLRISITADPKPCESVDDACAPSGPKIPRKILRLVLSDGYTYVTGLEVEPLGPHFSLTMPLGSKVSHVVPSI